MPQYTTGLVNVTNGSATVTGVGTSWLSEITPGNVFVRATMVGSNRVDDSVYYTVASVASDTSLTLTAPYGGATGEDQPYGITRELTPAGLPLLAPRSIGSVPIFNGAITALEAGIAESQSGADESLKIAENLADLDDAATARANLGLGTAAEADTGTGPDQVPTNSALGSAAYIDATDEPTPETLVLRDANGTTEFADATEDQHPVTLGQFIEATQWLGTAVSETKTLMTNNAALYPPTDSALFRYILLTAGEDGVGGYNEGLLINETITGSGDLVEATAEINMPSSPLHGTVVHLMNTEESVIVAGEAAGVFALDQMQRIVGTAQQNVVAVTSDPTGVYSDTPEPAGDAAAAGTARRYQLLDFNSANSPNARTSATTEGSTKPKRVSAQVFLCIYRA